MTTTVQGAAAVAADAAVASLRGRGADHTVTEIVQQPALWRVVGRDVAAWSEGRAAIAALLARPDLRIVLTGAGTSAFAGEVLAPVLRRARGGRVDAVATTAVVADPRGVFAEDVPTLLVSFARSGDSPESVATAELASDLLTECHHLVLTCNPDGELAKAHTGRPGSHVLLMPAGSNDRGFAMTSSFTCMLLAARLVLGAAVSPEATAERLAASVESTLSDRVAVTAALAAGRNSRIVYLGSGGLQGLARESALKLLELTAGAVVAIADSSLGFRHGPKAFLDDDTLALVYLSADPYTRRYDLDIVRELRAALPTGRVVAIGATVDDGLDAPVFDLPDVDGLDDALRALPAVVVAQLLALQASLVRGVGSDNPFPSGEVNRVVQGVTVHPLDPPA